jgi:hypothetical protein
MVGWIGECKHLENKEGIETWGLDVWEYELEWNGWGSCQMIGFGIGDANYLG